MGKRGPKPTHTPEERAHRHARRPHFQAYNTAWVRQHRASMTPEEYKPTASARMNTTVGIISASVRSGLPSPNPRACAAAWLRPLEPSGGLWCVRSPARVELARPRSAQMLALGSWRIGD